MGETGGVIVADTGGEWIQAGVYRSYPTDCTLFLRDSLHPAFVYEFAIESTSWRVISTLLRDYNDGKAYTFLETTLPYRILREIVLYARTNGEDLVGFLEHTDE